jgi:uncharacterized protein (TIGR02391 family)
MAGREVAHLERLLEGERWALWVAGGTDKPPRYMLHPSAALALGSADTLGEYLEAQANAWWQSELDVRSARGTVRVDRSAGESRAPAEDHAELRFDWLHPAIQQASESFMRAGFHAEAVLAAVNALQEEIRALARSKLDGERLMNAAFSPQGRPRISVADSGTAQGRNIRRGTHQLALGLVAAVRNPAAHGTADLTAAEALEQLAIASSLYRRLDDARDRRERRARP